MVKPERLPNKLILAMTMFFKTISFRLFAFISLFSGMFFIIKIFNLLPSLNLQNNLNSIPWLFSAISIIFSIISGFVIQSKWHTWDELIDAIRGELSSFRQLHIMAHHFPNEVTDTIRQQICHYLEVFINESRKQQNLGGRSVEIENALYDLEDTIFNARRADPESGAMAFNILRDCMTYREHRLQNSAHKLPLGIHVFMISATTAMIFSSLFIGVDMLLYDYIFTLIIGLLSYGIYLVIDDLDHPYRPGNWHLKADEYEELFEEVKKECGYQNHIE
ncbi:MAG TPA: hypothetical protein VGL94_02385 [Ktedonobacteraceae bacterium]